MSEPTRLQSVHNGSWTEPDPNAEPGGGGGPTETTPPAGAKDRAVSKARPSHGLPTDRMKFDKQIEILRVFAQLSGPTKTRVTAEDLGNSVGLSANTAGLSSGFFRDSGWIDKTGRGTYAATDALLNYNRHLNTDPGDEVGALPYLVESARSSWHWEAVGPLLDGEVPQAVLLQRLSKAAGAFDHKAQLMMLLDWQEWLGLIRRDGNLFRAGLAVSGSIPIDREREATVERVDGTEEHVKLLDERFGPVDHAPPAVAQAPAPAQSVVTDDAVRSMISFNLSVRITAEDAARLSPEQIKSLLEVVDKLRG